MTLCYRARPIDRSDQGALWVALVDRFDSQFDGLIYRPEGAFIARSVAKSQPVDPRLEQINREALARADSVVAFLPPGVTTLGVGREIEYARAARIPVAIVADRATWSGWDCEHFSLTAGGVDDAASWAAAVSGERPVPRVGRLPFVAEHPRFLPTRTYSGDAAYDLFVSQQVCIPVGQFRDVPCGVRVALPDGVWARITGRSSTMRQRGLMVVEGVIDNGWRGPLFAGVYNLGPNSAVLEPGERVAQMILHDNVSVRFAPVAISESEFEAIPHDGRGTNGFGSTG